MFAIIHDLTDDDYTQVEIINDEIYKVYSYNQRKEVWGSLRDILNPVSSKPPLGWEKKFSDLDPDDYTILATSDQLITADTHPELLI